MMSATQTSREELEFNDQLASGAPVPRPVQPGQVDPRATHYGYSSGEREIQGRPKDTGYAAILPGQLVPLRLFHKNVPNDTHEALGSEAGEEINQNRRIEVTPRDAADTLMSRYQHRGFRILLPLIGMDENRALKLYTIVHPKRPCSARAPGSKEFNRLKPFDQAILTRHCVACRIEYMRSDECLDTMEKAVKSGRVSQKPTIPYGFVDANSGEVRYVSEEEALAIVHELILSGLDEHQDHMIDTLVQSKTDVEAGKVGPGKKKFDKRDEWYFLMTHKSPHDIEAAAETARATGEAMAERIADRIVSSQKAATGDGLSEDQVRRILAENESAIEKRVEARLRKEFATKKGNPGEAKQPSA